MARKEVDLKEFGYDRPIVLKSIPYKAYSEFLRANKKDPDGLEANLILLEAAIDEAPEGFPRTREGLAEQPMEVIVELTMAVRDMLGPLVDRMREHTDTNSSKPTAPDGHPTQQ